MLTYNRKYFFVAMGLFFLELGIAFFVRDSIVRPYGGDFLVVIFLYCLLKSFIDVPVMKAILFVLSFSYLVEWMQYLDLVGILGLQKNILVNTVLGTSFEWMDILIYTLGGLFILILESGLQPGGGGKKLQ